MVVTVVKQPDSVRRYDPSRYDDICIGLMTEFHRNSVEIGVAMLVVLDLRRLQVL